MEDTTTQKHAKPGTACLGCRRRKLKCSRESEGCSNCMKSELPCVYPTPETGSKRKRGPYNKAKAPRERHLEDLVKYLEPSLSHSEANPRSDGTYESSPVADFASARDASNVPSIDQSTSKSVPSANGVDRKNANSEELVKDALIALTKSSAIGKDFDAESATLNKNTASQPSNEVGKLGMHPPMTQILKCWHLFICRVDPLTKVIHCPSFGKTFFAAAEDLQNVDLATETLMFSIYYAAISTCTAREARRRFGESREILLKRYGRIIESALSDNYSMPVLGSLQALGIYLISIRREDDAANIRALFSLAVRMAQLIGIHKDPGDSYPPFEAEMRRRVWWHICGLESRGAEEGGSRLTSIMEDTKVRLPGNYFDFDLDPKTTLRPQPRTGASDMTFVLIRWELMVLVHRLWAARKVHSLGNAKTSDDDIKSMQKKTVAEDRSRLESVYLQHLHESRPMDWICIKFCTAVMIKSRLIIEHPFGQMPSKEMSKEERFRLLQDSVEVIRITHEISKQEGLEDWLWFYRGWTQWHSLAIVIAELGYSTNKQFATAAWAVLDPALANWDQMYKHKREEPAWDHVNALIERARQMRQHNLVAPQDNNNAIVQAPQPTAPHMQPPSQQMIPDNQNAQFAQASYNGYIAPSPVVDASQGMDPSIQQYQIHQPFDVPFHTGCAPVMTGFEGDFGMFDNLGDIDFSAFDAVFGDTTWENSSLSTDFSMEMMNS